MGDVASGLLPVFPQVNAPDVGLDASGGTPEITDRSREGPFDIHHDRQRSVTSPQLLQDTQGCLFRMTSYDVEYDGPNFSPEHGVQLHDPRFLEYVGAPESARLMSRSPEYWVHHMGRENALSAALQSQHDAGLILSNVQVLQQLVTSLCRASSAISVQYRPTSDAVLQSAPCGTLHDGNGPVAPTSRYRDTNAHVFSRVQRLHILPELLPKSAYVKREVKLTMQLVTEYEQCCYIPCDLQCWDIVITGGCLDKLSPGCLSVGVCLLSRYGGLPSNCSLFRARLCWGEGVV